ncbi:MAG: hypothetical protein AB7P52_18930 [Alphaproteobacteria bacterium]
MDSEVEYERTEEHQGPPVEVAGMMLRVKNRLKRHEGWVNHMYRDVEGYVTVGVGFLLPKSEVSFYSWRYKATKRGAPLAAAQADWTSVSMQFYGRSYTNASYVAAFYDKYTNVELSDATIGFVLAKKLFRLHQDLRRAFKLSGIAFDNLPEPVQEAMFDLGWNVRRFLEPTTFPNMKAELKARNWEAAARESHRKSPPTPETRNSEIRDLILAAER